MILSNKLIKKNDKNAFFLKKFKIFLNNHNVDLVDVFEIFEHAFLI